MHIHFCTIILSSISSPRNAGSYKLKSLLRILSNFKKHFSVSFQHDNCFFLNLWASMTVNLLSSVPFQFWRTELNVYLAKFMKYCCLQVLFLLKVHFSVSVLEPTGSSDQGLASSWTSAICQSGWLPTSNYLGVSYVWFLHN